MISGPAMARANRLTSRLLVMILAIFPPIMSQDRDNTRSLKLRLIVPEPEVCLGTSKLSMEAVYSNPGDLPISVYASSLYDLSFIKTIVRGKQSKVEDHEIRKDVGTGDPARHESPILLPPHSSFVMAVEYDISDPFFGESGIYSVRARYMKMRTINTSDEAVVGDFGSNEVLFQMNDCN